MPHSDGNGEPIVINIGAGVGIGVLVGRGVCVGVMVVVNEGVTVNTGISAVPLPSHPTITKTIKKLAKTRSDFFILSLLAKPAVRVHALFGGLLQVLEVSMINQKS